MNVAKRIKEKTNLRESEIVIERLLIELYLRTRLSTKELARKISLPLPVVVAIKKELGKIGFVTEQQGTTLTTKGRLYVEHQLGWAAIDKEYYLSLLQSAEAQRNLKTALMDELENGISARPVVDVGYDQAFATIETIVERAFLLLKSPQFVGGRILFLGDDDLTSLAVGLLMKKLQRTSNQPAGKLTVYELSEDIIHCIQTSAEKLELGIECQKIDFRQGSLKWFEHQFDFIFVDPPYTISGLKLFLSRAVSGSKLGSSKIYLSFGEKSPNEQLAVQQLVSQQNLLIYQIKPKFNHYSGASILGGVSTLYELSTQQDSYAIISAKQPCKEAIYTGELNPRRTIYQCQRCQKTYEVGGKAPFKTIESLKEARCSACLSDRFIRKKRTPMPALKRRPHLGDHYLIELKNCPETVLKSVSTVEQLMLQIIEECELSAVTHYFHQFAPWGVSGVVILEESHFTIHTWPEENYAAVDLFVCQELPSEAQFISLVTDLFDAGEMVYRKVERGKRMGG